MSEQLRQNIVMMLSNTIRILMFGVLAIIFNKWWIILFSALFLSFEKGSD